MKYFSFDSRSLLALIPLLALGLAACGDLASFTITEESQEVRVNGAGIAGGCPPALGDLCLSDALNLDINLEQELQARDADGASGVFLEDLDLQITDTEMPEGDTDNFDFLDRLEIYAQAGDLERRRVAWIDEVPQGQQRISLNTDDDIDLKAYVEAGMTLQAEATGQVPEDDTSLKAVAEIRITLL